MDQKRELTSVDLAALVGELRRYEGAKLDKAYLYDDDLVRLKLRDYDEGRVELLIEVGETKRAHTVSPEHVPDAPGRPPNFAMMLRSRLSGADLVGVEQFEFDRIIQFHFDRPDNSTTIVAELFGDGNVAVLDEHGEVVDCLETVRLKSRTVAPGATYEFPSARFNPLTVDFDGFVDRFRQSDADVVRTLATQLNFGGLYGEELCSRAGVPYNQSIEDTGDDEFEALYGAVDRLATRLSENDLDSRVYVEPVEENERGTERGTETDDAENRRVDATPIPLKEYSHLESEPFETFTAALDAYFFRFDAGESTSDGTTGDRGRPDFESEINTKEHIVRQQESAIEEFEERAETEREKAELLYAHYGLVDEILTTVRDAREKDVSWDDIEATFDEGKERGVQDAERVVGVDGSEGTVTIDVDGTHVTVDVSIGVEKNADHRYQEAKRIEGKKDGALTAIDDTRADLEAVKTRRDEWEGTDGKSPPEGSVAESGDGEDDEPVDWLSKPSIPVRQTEQWYERFRWFHTSDGFLVIGGRNADQNEGLVEKYLERGDKFFHAQAHGGPVTVLKATGPSEAATDIDLPQSSLEQAATFAISHSSVWKDGRFTGDVYAVDPDQVSKTPESGEYLEKGGFAIRGDRTYFRDQEVDVSVGITCDDETRVIGGPTAAIDPNVATSIRVEPGRFAQNDVAKRLYREFKTRFADDSFVRKVASPDLIQEFLPPGGSRSVDS